MTINCKGNLIDLQSPKVMGILNCTPDSFYEGSRFTAEQQVLHQVEKMLIQGATFIDIGAYSSRPNAPFVSEEEELQRLLPVVEVVLEKFPHALLSIDTFRAKVADEALQRGASIINDISAAKQDEAILKVVAQHQVPYIMMHMRGTPQTMMQDTHYENLIKEMTYYFSERLSVARSYGINDCIIDPGFGFSKTMEQNYELLQKLELLQFLEVPMLCGVSRKSMVHKLLEITPQEALNGTTVLHTLCLTKKASILRVHDVKEAVECVKIYEAFIKA